MFAGITLGGLGTAYGAAVGCFVLGIFIQLSTLWLPTVAQERRCPRRADRRVAGPPAGHLRTTGAGGLSGLGDSSRDDVLGDLRPRAIVFVLAAMGLNFHYGYTGLMNFGQAAFIAAGAYGVAISRRDASAGALGRRPRRDPAPRCVLALLLGIPTLRLRGDYLAIVTIAASEIIRLVVRSEALEDVTGGNSRHQRRSPTPSTTLNPFNNGDVLRVRAVLVPRARTCGS